MRHLAIAVVVVAFVAASLTADLTGTEAHGWGVSLTVVMAWAAIVWDRR